MTIEKLDLLFPYFVLAYGAIMTLVLNIPALSDLAEHRLSPDLNLQLKAHRGFGVLCLIVGGLWCIQNLWV